MPSYIASENEWLEDEFVAFWEGRSILGGYVLLFWGSVGFLVN